MLENLFGLNNLINIDISTLISGFQIKSVIEIAILALILYVVYRTYIRGTQSERLLKGIFIVLLMLVASKVLIWMNFQIIGRFFETIVNIILIGLVVVFQPELRRFLGYLGQQGFLAKNIFNNNHEDHKSQINAIDELTDAVKYLSKSRTGALIVIQDHNESSGYMDVGTKINGLLSTELLLTIFHTNTALHDGAVIINGNRILSAGVLLPLTEDPKLSWQYGTRHRAAIGMSEVSNSLCIVVSEETGNVSVAQLGNLTKCEDLQHFRKVVKDYMGIEEKEEIKQKRNDKYNMLKFFKHPKKEQKPLSKSQSD